MAVKPLVYVAGPYTNPDPVINVRRACSVADALVRAGAAVVVPHLSMLWHLVSPADAEDWYQRDLDVLEHCDALVRFYGPSTGADREWDHAGALGIARFCFVQDDYDDLLPAGLPNWLAAWGKAPVS